MKVSLKLDLPAEVAANLPKSKRALTTIITVGLAHRQRRQRNEISDWFDLVDFLADGPSSEQILALRPTPARSKRVQTLLAKNQGDGLTAPEEAEMDALLAVEHAVSLAKARALAALNRI